MATARGKVIWASWMEFWPPEWRQWGIGPFKVVSVTPNEQKKCTCYVSGMLDPSSHRHVSDCDIYDLVIETPVGKRKVFWSSFKVL